MAIPPRNFSNCILDRDRRGVQRRAPPPPFHSSYCRTWNRCLAGERKSIDRIWFRAEGAAAKGDPANYHICISRFPIMESVITPEEKKFLPVIRPRNCSDRDPQHESFCDDLRMRVGNERILVDISSTSPIFVELRMRKIYSFLTRFVFARWEMKYFPCLLTFKPFKF